MCHENVSLGGLALDRRGDFPERVTLNKMTRILLFLVRSKLMRTRKQIQREETSHAQMLGGTVVLEWLEGEMGYGTAE